jgi:hypothetical protein
VVPVEVHESAVGGGSLVVGAQAADVGAFLEQDAAEALDAPKSVEPLGGWRGGRVVIGCLWAGVLVYLAGDVAPDATDDFAFGSAFGGRAFDVVACGSLVANVVTM